MPEPDFIPDPHVTVLAALWCGALRIAAGLELDPWPEDLAELAERYFALFRPGAQA